MYNDFSDVNLACMLSLNISWKSSNSSGLQITLSQILYLHFQCFIARKYALESSQISLFLKRKTKQKNAA